MANSDCRVISFNSTLEEALKCLSEFHMARALKFEQKEAILEMIYWPCCQLAFGKA